MTTRPPFQSFMDTVSEGNYQLRTTRQILELTQERYGARAQRQNHPQSLILSPNHSNEPEAPDHEGARDGVMSSQCPPELKAHVEAALRHLLNGNEYKLAWDEPPSQGHNKITADAARKLLLAQYPFIYNQNNTSHIDDAIYRRISYLRKAQTRCSRRSSPGDSSLAPTVTAAVFDTRLRITTDPRLPHLHKHAALVSALGHEGVSDHEETRPGSREFTTYRKRWLSPEVSDLVHGLDKHYAEHFQQPRFIRTPSGKIKLTDDAIPGLPWNAYDPGWLSSLDTNQKRALNPLSVTHDFSI